MTKIPIDYQTTVIYKICCNDTNVNYTYVGHATKFSKRRYQHKTSCNNTNSKLYQTIRENGGWENWAMIKIEDYPCNDRQDACKREIYWYNELNAGLNMRLPFFSDEEKAIYMKDYRKTNCEEIKQSRKKYYQINKEFEKEYYKSNIERMKEYQNKNREKILEYNKNYYKTNKEKMKTQYKEYHQLNKENIYSRNRLYYQINKNIINENEEKNIMKIKKK